MKNGTLYPTNNAIALLLIGEPGSGKTCHSMLWPDPWFLDADHNLKAAKERNPGKAFHFDNPEQDDNEKPLEAAKRWQRCRDLLAREAGKPEVKTIVIDGLTRLCDYLQDYLCDVGAAAGEKKLVVGGITCMSQSLWGPFARLMNQFIWDARAFNKPLIMTCHVKIDENDLTSVKEQRPNISGQLSSNLAGRFTDYWMAMAEPTSDAVKYPSGARYVIKTAPTSRIQLKQSFALPATFDSDGPEVKALMARLTASVAPVATK